MLIIITLNNLSAPDLREASGTEVLKVNFIKYYSLLHAIIPQYPSLNKRREKLLSACKGLLLREEIYRKCINCSPFKGNTQKKKFVISYSIGKPFIVDVFSFSKIIVKHKERL